MQEKQENLELVPRQTWIQHGKTLLWLLVGSCTFLVGIDGLSTGDTGIWWSLSFVAFGLVGIYMASTRVFIRYKFSDDFLEILAWGNKQPIAWEDIIEVDILPNFFTEPSMSVTTISGKTEVINTSYFRSTKKLNLTLLETIHSHNPNVKIGSFALGMYGQPPYGILD